MKYQTAAAFRTALEQRLLTRSQATGMSLARLRKLVAFDRMLARLVQVAPGRWVLKGGLALDLRLRERARTTVDLDIARQDDEAAANRDFRSAEQADPGDYFALTVSRTPRLDRTDAGGAVRYHVRMLLAGRLFEEFVLDVGFGDPTVPHPDLLVASDLLAFAEIPEVRVPVLPLPQHVAEKVHAYSRVYGARGAPSSRAKDLVDLVLLSDTSTFLAGALRVALVETFSRRGTHALPARLPDPPTEWRAQYRELATSLGIPPDLWEGHQLASTFLGPILAGTAAATSEWDPTVRTWNERAGRTLGDER